MKALEISKYYPADVFVSDYGLLTLENARLVIRPIS